MIILVRMSILRVLEKDEEDQVLLQWLEKILFQSPCPQIIQMLERFAKTVELLKLRSGDVGLAGKEPFVMHVSYPIVAYFKIMLKLCAYFIKSQNWLE